MKEERVLTNIKLTERNEDNIWLHFESKGLKARVSLEALVCMQASGSVAAIIQNWAREQLDKKKVDHQRFYLEPPSKVGVRPSPPVEGGY